MNRILTITRSSIPYVKELNVLTGGVIASILMQQLDYWFDKYPNGYYKFLEPSNHKSYKKGTSWQEELGVSIKEFRTAFDAIGIRYGSRTDYDAAVARGDLFQGKMYASYYDRRTNLTTYLRNDELVDRNLDALIAGTYTRLESSPKPPTETADAPKAGAKQDISQAVDSKADAVMGFTQMPKGEMGQDVAQPLDFQVGAESASTDIPNGNLCIPPEGISGNADGADDLYRFTNTTSETTTTMATGIATSTGNSPVESNGSSSDSDKALQPKALKDLIYPNVSDRERIELHKLMRTCPEDRRQDLLDEIEGKRRTGGLKVGAVSLANALMRAIYENKFTPAAGLPVAAEREQRRRNAQAVATSQQGSTTTPGLHDLSEADFQRLPQHIQQLARAAAAKAKEAAA